VKTRCSAFTHSYRLHGEETSESMHRCFLERVHDGSHQMDPRERVSHWHEWDGVPDSAKAGINRKDNVEEIVMFERACGDVGCHSNERHMLAVLDVANARAKQANRYKEELELAMGVLDKLGFSTKVMRDRIAMIGVP
jgi:hypothetical protein